VVAQHYNIGEMKSYSPFSRSPRFTAYVSINRVFGDFAEKTSDLLEIAKKIHHVPIT
jgi:hypothetical protein